MTENARVARLFKRALLRDTVVLAGLYSIPGLRRWRRWYWRLSGGAMVAGALYGYVLIRQERRRLEST
jgi:hypothetical protein